MISKIENAVKTAGRHFMKGFNGAKEVSHKAKSDLVTQYDVEVEKILMQELSFMLPEYMFVAEETASAVKPSSGKAIYIDPIDGTTNFVHGFPFCCISVGVYSGGEGLCGVVYNPVMDEMFTACKGGGAYLNGKRIFASAKETLSDTLFATGFPYSAVVEKHGEMMGILGRVLNSTRGVRRAGSAALDLCYTARGVFDAYYEFNLQPWDIAAGVIIASEAGAFVCDGELKYPPDLYGKFILACSQGIKEEVIQTIIKHP
jgi:myo-inositol-1(or 4)-monophosphatase